MDNKFLYLYCVTDSYKDKRLLMTGIDERDITCLELDNFMIWYSETDKNDINCNFENLKIHNNVSLDLMDKCTVIPFKFGTIVKGKQGIVSLGNKLYSYFNENITKLAGKYEAGIKVFGEVGIEGIPDQSRQTAAARLTSIKSNFDSKGYFIDRIRMYEEEKIKEKCIEGLKDTLLTGLIALSDDYKIMNKKSSKLLINSAFLIKKENAKIFEEQFDSIKSKHPDYSFLFSGPWPPYNFVSILREGD
jgi:hypothetical protein